MRAPRTLVVMAAIASCAALLTGCKAPGFPTPSPSGSTSDQAADPSASPSDVGVAIPTDCTKTMSPSMLAATFTGVPLNDPAFAPTGVIEPGEPPTNVDVDAVVYSQVSLRCVWQDPEADVTGLQLSIARIDPEVGALYLSSLAGQEYTCEDRYGGRWCQLISKHPDYPVDMGNTSFLRDDVYIGVYQANFPTNGLLADVVATIWAD